MYVSMYPGGLVGGWSLLRIQFLLEAYSEQNAKWRGEILSFFIATSCLRANVVVCPPPRISKPRRRPRRRRRRRIHILSACLSTSFALKYLSGRESLFSVTCFDFIASFPNQWHSSPQVKSGTNGNIRGVVSIQISTSRFMLMDKKREEASPAAGVEIGWLYFTWSSINPLKPWNMDGWMDVGIEIWLSK